MGTGTAPEEGAALAVALLEEFRARHSLTHCHDASRPAEVLRFDDAWHREWGDGIRRRKSAADVPVAGRGYRGRRAGSKSRGGWDCQNGWWSTRGRV